VYARRAALHNCANQEESARSSSMAPADKSVLIITLPPVLGGVTNMSRLTADILARHGYTPTLAWRAYYSDDPGLSVPAWKLGRRRPALREVAGWPYRRLAVGTWLPEFEWAHHADREPWRSLFDQFRHHVVVSGNNLTGFGLVERGLPSLQWIASPYMAERVDRYRTLGPGRRLFSTLLNEPVTRRQERRILEGADTIAISNYTLITLRDLAPRNRVRGVVTIPVDCERFSPVGRESGRESSRDTPAGRRLRIGTNGRLSDPRKNIALMADAFRIVAAERPDVDLVIRSDLTREQFLARTGMHDLAGRLDIAPPVPASELPGFYRGLDVYAICSWQEGLCIAGTEAMACGATVVSTRCGGPEDFVWDRQTGRLSGFGPLDFATRLLEGLDDATGSRALATAGVDHIRERFDGAAVERDFMGHFARTFG
jgi:glycosyltransferase involved in cell wall biosynthesis